ncbi:MAG: hypothetical protein ABIJ09_13955 [Pseudomonadota bacterium]
MSTAGDQHRCDEGVAFFGAVVAAQCHEVINVLNILNEVAGLIEDLSAAPADERGRVQALAQKLQAQVQRGQGLVRSISHFAHSTDANHAVIDAVDLLRGALDLLERPVRLTNSTLSHDFHDSPVVIETCPYLLLQLVFSAVQVWLETPPVALTLRIRPVDQGLLVELDGQAFPDPLTKAAQQRVSGVRQQLHALGGTLRACPPEHNARIAFWLPAHAGTATAHVS